MQPPLRQHLEKIVSLTDEEFEYVAAHFTARKLRRSQYLVQQGESVRHEYYVLSGCLKAYHVDGTGKEHILQFAMADWWITDYQAYFRQEKAIVHVDCLRPSEVLCLSLENREKLCREMHKMEHFFRLKLTSGFVALQQRILSTLSSSTQERYEQLLTLYPQLFQQVPKQYIAAYLGVSRETLSRLYTSTR